MWLTGAAQACTPQAAGTSPWWAEPSGALGGGGVPALELLWSRKASLLGPSRSVPEGFWVLCLLGAPPCCPRGSLSPRAGAEPTEAQKASPPTGPGWGAGPGHPLLSPEEPQLRLMHSSRMAANKGAELETFITGLRGSSGSHPRPPQGTLNKSSERTQNHCSPESPTPPRGWLEIQPLSKAAGKCGKGRRWAGSHGAPVQWGVPSVTLGAEVTSAERGRGSVASEMLCRALQA